MSLNCTDTLPLASTLQFDFQEPGTQIEACKKTFRQLYLLSADLDRQIRKLTIFKQSLLTANAPPCLDSRYHPFRLDLEAIQERERAIHSATQGESLLEEALEDFTEALCEFNLKTRFTMTPKGAFTQKSLAEICLINKLSLPVFVDEAPLSERIVKAFSSAKTLRKMHLGVLDFPAKAIIDKSCEELRIPFVRSREGRGPYIYVQAIDPEILFNKDESPDSDLRPLLIHYTALIGKNEGERLKTGRFIFRLGQMEGKLRDVIERMDVKEPNYTVRYFTGRDLLLDPTESQHLQHIKDMAINSLKCA